MFGVKDTGNETYKKKHLNIGMLLLKMKLGIIKKKSISYETTILPRYIIYPIAINIIRSLLKL